jgi:hypothetical protein
MKAQPKTNEVLELMFSKISNKEVFSEMDGARIRRDINSLPEYSEIHMSLGVFFTVQKNRPKTIMHFEKAIKTVNAPTCVFLNYITCLNSHNLYHDASVKTFEFADLTHSPELYNTALCASTFLLDIETYNICFEKLTKMNKLIKNNRNKDCVEEMDIINNFVVNNNVTSEQLKSIGNIAAKTGQEYGVKMLGNTITHRAERKYLSVDYHISSEECTPSKICDLNYSFIEKLIDSDLDGLPVTITFVQVSKENMISRIEEGNRLHVS